MRRILSALGLVVAQMNAGAQPGAPVVRLYLDNVMLVPKAHLTQARETAAGIYAAVGVRMVWKEERPRSTNSGDETLQIRFDDSVPANLPADAMGYAVPDRSGHCIHIFYNRVRSAAPRLAIGTVLGHVLAHEIGHVLEGIARHSEEGLMKAHWTSDDYRRMSRQSLPFAALDVELIHKHFAANAARPAGVGNR